jgi:hypothetical protein
MISPEHTSEMHSLDAWVQEDSSLLVAYRQKNNVSTLCAGMLLKADNSQDNFKYLLYE